MATVENLDISFEEELSDSHQSWSAFISLFLKENEIVNSLSFKFNIVDVDGTGVSLQDIVESIILYVRANSEAGSTMFATLGEHRLGVNEKAHYHLNILAPAYISGNESRRRKKYCSDNDVVLPAVTMKEGLIKDKQQALDCLAYPFKEGHCEAISTHYVSAIPGSCRMFLKTYSKELFQVKLQRDRAKARASERSKNLLSGLESLCVEHSFSNYNDFKNYIYDAFYDGLELDEYPEFKNLQNCVQKIAIKYKIVRPAYFDKY